VNHLQQVAQVIHLYFIRERKCVMKSLFEDTMFDWSCSEHSDEAKEYMFADTQCLNKTRPDESLMQPRQHEIDPPYNSVVAMCVNHP